MSIEDQIDGAAESFFRADKSVTDQEIEERKAANKIPEDLEGQKDLVVAVAHFVRERGFGPTLFGMSLVLGRIAAAMYAEMETSLDPHTVNQTSRMMLALSQVGVALQTYAEAFDGQVMELLNPEAVRGEMIQPMELMKNAKP